MSRVTRRCRGLTKKDGKCEKTPGCTWVKGKGCQDKPEAPLEKPLDEQPVPPEGDSDDGASDLDTIPSASDSESDGDGAPPVDPKKPVAPYVVPNKLVAPKPKPVAPPVAQCKTTGYKLFSEEMRPKLIAEDPTLTNFHAGAKLAKMYRELPYNEWNEWEDKAGLENKKCRIKPAPSASAAPPPKI